MDSHSGPEIVECLSGASYGERPIALTWQDSRLLIEAIEDSWRLPDGRRFRVRVEDGRVFELRYKDISGEWRIHIP
jgi:hypothetical protein